MRKIIKIITYIILLMSLCAKVFNTGTIFFADAAPLSMTDGSYLINAELVGGTGRVSINSPIPFEVRDGEIRLKIVWSSGYYDFMKISGTEHRPVEQDSDTTTFSITVNSFEPLNFTAQTSKMSRPHEIEYSIVFDEASILPQAAVREQTTGVALVITAILAAASILLIFFFSKRKKNHAMMLVLTAAISALALVSCSVAVENGKHYVYAEKPEIGINWVGREELKYAEGFAVDYYDGGVTLIRVCENNFLFLPKGFAEKKDAQEQLKIGDELAKNLVTLEKPSNIYLTATSVMAFLHDIDEMTSIGFAGTKSDGWGLDYAREALEGGKIKFAGKYSAPDYEMLVKEDCDLAVFSTMITHAPDVSDKMKEVGIPVFVDYSSYESHPLGRTEWIKVYGAIFDKQEFAAATFSAQDALLQSAETLEKTDAEIAFFSISSSGKISARKSEDYVAKMIEIAGGRYAYKSVDDAVVSALAINMEREAFFRETSDSDIIIYNTTTGGGFDSKDSLIKAHPLLSELSAVQKGNIWVTTDAFYQSTTSHGSMVAELAEIIRLGNDMNASESEEKFTFFKKLK